jgi:DNA-binding transcriptional LysR family regulator
MDRLAAMETLVRVIKAGSFSSAAKQLRVGQPAVSKTIAQLEDRLGVRLLLRSTHGLTPTDAGLDFYERAKRSIEDVEEAEAVARGAAVTLSGRLWVNAPLTFGRLHVIPRLPIFMTEHPSLDVEIVLDDRDIDLIEAGIDVALRLGPLRDSGTIARKIGNCRSCVVGKPAYFARHGRPKAPGDLVEHQAVIYEQRVGGPTWTFCQGTTETTVTLRGRLRVSTAEGVREGVLAGLGLSIGGSEWLFAPELKSGAVIAVLQDWSLPAVDLWALFPAGRQASAKARTFTSFIEQQFAGGELFLRVN